MKSCKALFFSISTYIFAPFPSNNTVSAQSLFTLVSQAVCSILHLIRLFFQSGVNLTSDWTLLDLYEKNRVVNYWWYKLRSDWVKREVGAHTSEWLWVKVTGGLLFPVSRAGRQRDVTPVAHQLCPKVSSQLVNTFNHRAACTVVLEIYNSTCRQHVLAVSL